MRLSPRNLSAMGGGVIVLALLVLIPTQSAAQCQTCERCAAGTKHQMPGSTGDLFSAVHEDCLGPTGSCVPGHPICGGSLLDPAEREREDQLRDMLDDAVHGDLSAVFSMLDSHADRVAINRERSALQVASLCDPSRMIAHIPLTSDHLPARVALPRLRF